MILFENDDFVVHEFPNFYSLISKSDSFKLIPDSNGKIKKIRLDKDEWCVIGKTYSEIKKRLKLFGYCDVNISTWHGTEVILIHPVTLLDKEKIVEALNLKEHNVLCFESTLKCFVVDIPKLKELIKNGECN